MLRLVASRQALIAPELRQVAIWRLDAELAAYVERRLSAHWPRLRVHRIGDDAPLEAVVADLCICGANPPPELRAPALWLGEVDRSAGVARLGERLWKCTMPVTGRHLMDAVDALWEQACG